MDILIAHVKTKFYFNIPVLKTARYVLDNMAMRMYLFDHILATVWKCGATCKQHKAIVYITIRTTRISVNKIR